jgi:thioesterase domain-containing protein
MAAVRRYVPQTYPGRLDLFLASADSIRIGFDRPLDWSLYAADGATVHKGPDGCEGSRMLREPYVRQVAARLRERLAASHG